DTPDDLIFDLYQTVAYPGQAIGAPILGTADIVANMPHDALSKYTSRFYTPEKLILSAAGHIDHDELVRLAEDIFSDYKPSNDNAPAPTAIYHGGETR
ncbi:insulinase family protein, partial [Flavihumibacter sediminis]|nr:insulinase family protein [Flavihumibacter sediminis]